MATDKLIVPNGATLERWFLRSYKIAAPDADTDTGQPKVDARAARDMILPLVQNAVTTADTSSLDNRSTADLNAIGAAENVKRPPAVGASGYVLARSAQGRSGRSSSTSRRRRRQGRR